MTAVLHEIVTNPGLCVIIAACVAVTAFVAVAERRSREIDAAIAEDTRRIERDRQQIADLERRITEAKRKDQDALNEVLGLDGGDAA